MFLGVAYLECAREIADLKLAIGSDDSSTWSVNGREVIRVYAGRPVKQDENVSEPLTLKKGVNVLRFAVINGNGPSGACARFLDKAGKPVAEFTLLPAPPPGGER